MEGSTAGLPLLSFDGPVATLRLNRPERHNALSAAVWRALPAQIAQVEECSQARVLVVRGEGGTFAAGADITEFDTVFRDRDATLAYAAEMAKATAALEALSIPVIAQIEGLCVGAGVAVALACDIRLGAADARFAVTPAKLGLMYSLADTKRLLGAVGPSAAKDLLFTGRMLDAAQAARIGLVDAVFPTAELELAVSERAGLIANASSWSVAKAKQVVRLLLDGATAETEQTRAWFADAPETPDFREGLAAFRDRRKPAFPSR